MFVTFLISNQLFVADFWAIKVMHFRLDENIMAALNNERLVEINFIELFSVVLTKESTLFQSRVIFFFYLVTEFTALQFLYLFLYCIIFWVKKNELN